MSEDQHWFAMELHSVRLAKPALDPENFERKDLAVSVNDMLRSPIAPPLGAPSAPDQRDRSSELVRTHDALNEEVRSLMRTRSTLVDEISALRGNVQEAARQGQTFDRFAEGNRRFFERVLEREVARTAREANGRFSMSCLRVQQGLPDWFPGFLVQFTRASDFYVRSGAREFLLFLHGAGGLGRRVFASRLSQSLEIARRHHRTDVEIFVGSATYPSDAIEPRLLISTARERLGPVDPETLPRPPVPGELEPIFQLLPPQGKVFDRPDHRSRVRRSLEEAAANGASGEVVVRSKEVVGRVYMCHGKVAWAHCSSRAISLTEYLVRSCGADPEEVRFAYEYCKKSGGNFAETLIEFGTFDRFTMRQVLQRHLRAHMEAVMQLPAPEVLFLPQNRRYHSDLLFDLEGLMPRAGDAQPRQHIVEKLARRQ